MSGPQSSARVHLPPRPSGDRFCLRCGVQVVTGNHVCKSGQTSSQAEASREIAGKAHRARPQRQDSLTEQMAAVLVQAVEDGCYDAHD